MADPQRPPKQYYNPPAEKTYEIPDELIGGHMKAVLVLEDDEGLTTFLTESLEGYSCSVTVATNGVEGLRKVMAQDYDVILCDMVMPNLSGDMFYLAVERVRPHLCKRFIFMTGHREDQNWGLFAREKGCLILYKPFKFEVLLESIQMVVAKTGA